MLGQKVAQPAARASGPAADEASRALGLHRVRPWRRGPAPS